MLGLFSKSLSHSLLLVVLKMAQFHLDMTHSTPLAAQQAAAIPSYKENGGLESIKMELDKTYDVDAKCHVSDTKFHILDS